MPASWSDDDVRARDAVARRRQRVADVENHILDLATRLASSPALEDSQLSVLGRAAALSTDHLRALGAVALPGRQLAARSTDADAEELTTTAAGLVYAYGSLYATARLLCDRQVADEIAAPFAEEWREELVALGDLLVSRVHGELLSQGLTCQCVCPACGIGACLCTRNSIDTLRAVVGAPDADAPQGVPLLMPPRPGSEMERVGMAMSDRILAVDEVAIGSNSDLQRALRSHPIGEPMKMSVERAGEVELVSIVRVSDWP